MSKYPISKEFFPYSRVAPPIQNAKVAGFLGSLMRAPGWIWRNKDASVRKEFVKSYDGEDVELLIFEPHGIAEPAPALVYYHGGGFFFGAAGYHYKLAIHYALNTPCKIIFAQYRLAPKNPHPTPSEDCYAAFRFAVDNAERLGIDKRRVAVGGDSAGGALAAAVCQMARDLGTSLPLFQLLIYPVTDRRMQTESCRIFTDTPMWNSRLSVKMWQGYIQSENADNLAYASPMEAKSFSGLPDAYVETAEFDCLRDEGLAYAKALQSHGAAVSINETKGTMHGYDIVAKSSITKASVLTRVKYMAKMFNERD